MDYGVTYNDEGGFLTEVERAVENISLGSLLNSLYYKAYDVPDVERMSSYIGSCLQKMNEEYERMKRYRVEFLNTFATKDNKHYEKRRVLMGKMRISFSRIKQLCQKFHRRSPRQEMRLRRTFNVPVPTVYESSVLTNASSTCDMFGLEGYPDCVKGLFHVMMRFKNLMLDILLLCRNIINTESEYRKDPDRCVEIMNDFKHKCMSYYTDVIDSVDASSISCTNELRKMREDYPMDIAFAPVAYHNVGRSDMRRMVLKEACEERMLYGLCREEQLLWGNDVETVMLVRKLIAAFDSLLPAGTVFRGNKLPAKYVAMFMRWCGITNLKVERTFVKYFGRRYLENGTHRMVDNSSVNKAKNSALWDDDPEYRRFCNRINEVKMS